MCLPKELKGQYTHWPRYHCVFCGKHEIEKAVQLTTPDGGSGMVMQLPKRIEARRKCCYQSIIQAAVPAMLGSCEHSDLVSRGGFVVTEPNETEIHVTWMSSEEKDEE